MNRKVAISVLVGTGLLVALFLAFVVSPYASSQPDGLERVAEDKGFLDTADDHALADGPLADYGTKGVDSEKLSTGVAGLIGVTVTFAVGIGVFLGLKALRGRSSDRVAVAGGPVSPSGP